MFRRTIGTELLMIDPGGTLSSVSKGLKLWVFPSKTHAEPSAHISMKRLEGGLE